MKITILLIVLFIGFNGCAIKERLPKEVRSGTIEHAGINYSIVKPIDFEINGVELYLSYRGSLEHYHLFRCGAKFGKTNEICMFAIERKYCIVEGEVLLSKDQTRRGYHFDAARLVDGKIYTRRWNTTKADSITK